MTREDEKLARSILHHTEWLGDIDTTKQKSNSTFVARIVFLFVYGGIRSNIGCQVCGKVTFDSVNKDKFSKFCRKHAPKYPSVEYFKAKFGDSWEKKQQEDREKRKKQFKDHLSLDWHIKKYGKLEGKKKYDAMVKRIHKKFKYGYSKISQELFDAIANVISGTKYATAGGEKKFFLRKEERKYLNGQKTMYVDFIYDKKIIEFNGDYWHKDSKEKDLVRESILNRRGYKVLTIWESEYNSDKEKTIKRCLDFLSEENNKK